MPGVAVRSARKDPAVVAKAKAQGFKSDFVGVCWQKRGWWTVSIKRAGKQENLGQFLDEQEAARAFDAAARRLRPQGEAHGVKSGRNWLRLNFPTVEEEGFAAQQGMQPAKKRKVAQR